MDLKYPIQDIVLVNLRKEDRCYELTHCA